MADRPNPEQPPPLPAGPRSGVPTPAPPAVPSPAAPGRPASPSERVADADRDRTVTLLREHVIQGRLTLDEFSERMGAALEARTRGELSSVMSDLPSPVPPDPASPVASPRQARRWHVALMSGHSTKGRWRIGAKTNAVAIMGGCDLDLRRAEIEGPVVEITAFAFWGGIDIVVPEGIDVELRGFSFMGGRSLRLRDVPIVPGSPRIVVRAYACMAGVKVRSRPNRSPAGLARSAAATVLGALSDPSGPPHSSRSSRSSTSKRESRAGSPDRSLPADGTVTILFCDMSDYAGMTERLGDQASHRVLREHHRIVREALERHGGREVSVQGDGFMVAFGGAARALRCAVDIQRGTRASLPLDGDEPIAVHIGVNTGDAMSVGDDYLGHTVIVASRLADAAGPGEILVSSLCEQLVAGSGEFTFDGHRDTPIKGMERPQPSVSLLWDG
jgi:class 3 adenylate cyclase